MITSSPRRGALVVVAAACIVGLSACGNAIPDVTDAGNMGLTVDAAGQPVIAVVTCARTTVAIDMFEGRKKSDPEDKVSVERGDWVARRPFAGVQKLSITAPGGAWKTKLSPGALEPETHFVLEGRTTEKEYSSLKGVDFRTRDLAKMSPDRVEVLGKPMSWKAFAAYTCS